jgi:hypothetical protein
MREETVKSTHARFQHFEPGDTVVNNFPFKTFSDFSMNEKSQNRSGLWVTKTVGNHTSNVQFTYTGEAFEGNPLFPVVHFGDRRYVKFFANEYCRSILNGEITNGKPLDEPYGPLWKNIIVGIDNYDWNYNSYGYSDISGNFQYGSGFSWDKPYPQNMGELTNAVTSFQSQLKKYAPDVPIMVNGGGIKDTNTYDKLFKGLEGKFFEGFMYYFEQGYWDRLQIYWQLQSARWMDRHNKITIFQAGLPDTYSFSSPGLKDVIRTMTCAYLIARGQNSFYGLSRDTTDYDYWEIEPKHYQYLKSWMGMPLAPFEVKYEDNDLAYGLYKRKYAGGWVYLNLTGKEQTIGLNGTFYDREGKAITSITIPDFRGDIVRLSPQDIPAMVSINNRYSDTISGNITVQIASPTPNTEIRYTTDGSVPTNTSTLYAGPIVLNNTGTVRAIAVKVDDPKIISFVNTARYNITTTKPTVSFHFVSDTVSEFLKNGYALVALDNLSATSAKVKFSVSGAATNKADYTLTDGIVEFKPFEKYRVIRIPIIDDKSIENIENVRLTLYSVDGAVLGRNTVFDYYIQDNDGILTSLSSDFRGENNLRIWPNPAKNELLIEGYLSANTTYEIASVDGKILKTGLINNQTVRVEDFEAGLYIIKIKNGATEAVQRFVKE